MVLIHGVRHINFAEVFGQFDVLCWRHVLISKKNDLMGHQCVVNGLCALGCDVAELDINLSPQGWSKTFNFHPFPPLWDRCSLVFGLL